MPFDFNENLLKEKPDFLIQIFNILKNEKIINAGKHGIKINSHYGREKGNSFFINHPFVKKYLDKFPNLFYFIICFNNNLKEVPKCPFCNNILSIDKYKVSSFLKTCGKKTCADKSSENTNRRNNNGLLYNQTLEAKLRTKKVCMEKYGVENPSQLEEIKFKKINTCRQNYQVDHPSQNKEVLKKQKEIMIKKYKGMGLASKEIMEKQGIQILKNMELNIPKSFQR